MAQLGQWWRLSQFPGIFSVDHLQQEATRGPCACIDPTMLGPSPARYYGRFRRPPGQARGSPSSLLRRKGQQLLLLDYRIWYLL